MLTDVIDKRFGITSEGEFFECEVLLVVIEDDIWVNGGDRFNDVIPV
jgi:hypothetical protein